MLHFVSVPLSRCVCACLSVCGNGSLRRSSLRESAFEYASRGLKTSHAPVEFLLVTNSHTSVEYLWATSSHTPVKYLLLANGQTPFQCLLFVH